MTQPLVSILLPHLRNASNDQALRICLDCLVANTDMNYELLLESVEERRDIYGVINNMALRANAQWIIPFNTDVFVAPGWIRPLWDSRDINVIVSPVMVECGAIAVSDRNLEHDFGRTPEAFQRTQFEAWVDAGGAWKPEWGGSERAWYFPSLLSRRQFLASGAFDTTRGAFPDPLDKYFWDTWEQSGGAFRRVMSYVYHLQAWSDGVREDAHR